jgi:uncharacterized surface protein with fasciclin (FAS1) repeats
MIKNKAILFLILICAIGCQNEFEKYYARPENIKGPIYEQLQNEGRFSIFLSCIDKTTYKNTLNRTGYFTVFAPNDEAFKKMGITSIDQLDTFTIKNIVLYSIINYGYTPDQLAAYQSPNGWQYGKAFRRQTRLNEYVISDSIIDTTRLGYNKSEILLINKKSKYVTYFLNQFFLPQNLNENDFKTFYPNTEYKGFHILDATVIGKQIIAENGYIYELDKVNLPSDNIDEALIKNKNKFSKFKYILDKFVTYKYDSLSSIKYGKPVYSKTYNTLKNTIDANISVLFTPNNEDWMSSGLSNDNPSQTNSWTLFVPSDDAVDNFIKTKLSAFNYSIDEVFNQRPEIFSEFINAHMFTTAKWPSQFASNERLFGTSLNNSNLTFSYVASNGFLYGIDKLLETNNIFNSVFGELMLNPKYSIMYVTALKDAAIKNVLTNKDLSYTLFLCADSAYNLINYKYSDSVKSIVKISEPTKNALDSFKVIFYYQIAKGDNEDLSGSGFLTTYNNGYIKFDNYKLWGYGNIEKNSTVNVLETIFAPNNGTVFIIDKPILPPTRTYASVLSSPPAGASFSRFYNLITALNLIVNGKLNGIAAGQAVTILVPTDDAIASYTGAKNENFILNHIIPGKIILTDGNFKGFVKTLCVSYMYGKTKIYTELQIGGDNNNITITDDTGQTANVLKTSGSNIFTTDNAVILQIDKALKY